MLVSDSREKDERNSTLQSKNKYCKRLTELKQVYNRRERLLKKFRRYSSRFVSSVILWSQSSVLSVEDLNISTYHKKGIML